MKYRPTNSGPRPSHSINSSQHGQSKTATFRQYTPTLAFRTTNAVTIKLLGHSSIKKILRTYTIDGEKHKEEGLSISKEGSIYITSRRVLIVGDGTTSIPHSKILDAEIDPDNDVISITKDGRQKPLFLRVPDLIYTGILLEAVSTHPD